jgi:anaerobic ribonucleoside-triphosphate reductase activating protein
VETRAEGPGARFAIWAQGCSIRCPGCCNPHLFESDGGEVLRVDELLAKVRAARDRIEGVTLLGGEPFEQARAFASLARGVRALGLSVIAFSGFTREELAARSDARELIDALDVLVDGRYRASSAERQRRWVGSTNQRFHYLTDRYGPDIERPTGGEPLRTVEIAIAPDGRVRANGWPALIGLGRSRR